MDRIEKLKEYLHASPTDSFLKHALALEHVKVGNEDAAKQLFREILGHDPGYIGSYYHLAKLLERIGEQDEAIKVYEKGMEEAKNAGDNHAFNELQAAYEDLVY